MTYKLNNGRWVGKVEYYNHYRDFLELLKELRENAM